MIGVTVAFVFLTAAGNLEGIDGAEAKFFRCFDSSLTQDPPEQISWSVPTRRVTAPPSTTRASQVISDTTTGPTSPLDVGTGTTTVPDDPYTGVVSTTAETGRNSLPNQPPTTTAIGKSGTTTIPGYTHTEATSIAVELGSIALAEDIRSTTSEWEGATTPRHDTPKATTALSASTAETGSAPTDSNIATDMHAVSSSVPRTIETTQSKPEGIVTHEYNGTTTPIREETSTSTQNIITTTGGNFNQLSSEGVTGMNTESIAISNETADAAFEFVFTFLPIKCNASKAIARVSISPAGPGISGSGQVAFPLGSDPGIPFTIEAGLNTVLDLPTDIVLPSNVSSLRTETTTIRITSDVNVNVFAHLSCVETGNIGGTSFRVKCTNDLGKEYRLATYWDISNTFFGVTNLNRETVVHITSANGSSHDVTLGPYESVAYGYDGDLTGTSIFSEEPVSVLVGNDGDSWAGELNSGTDFFYESMTPVDRWGTTYALMPLIEDSAIYIIRVVPYLENTYVECTFERKLESTSWGQTVQPGEFFERLLDSDDSVEYIEITSNKDVLVVVISAVYGSGTPSSLTPSISLVTVPSIQEPNLAKHYVFPLFDVKEAPFDVHFFYYLIVWMPLLADRNLITLDGTVPLWEEDEDTVEGVLMLRKALDENPANKVLENGGNFTMKAIVYAWSRKRSYAYVLA